VLKAQARQNDCDTLKIQACISLGQGQLSALSRPLFMTHHPRFLLFAGAFLIEVRRVSRIWVSVKQERWTIVLLAEIDRASKNSASQTNGSPPPRGMVLQG